MSKKKLFLEINKKNFEIFKKIKNVKKVDL